MSSGALHRTLTIEGDHPIRLLPAGVAELLESLDAPPRLAAHLRLVHDVACELADALIHEFPNAAFDCNAVLFGAATHDVGKVVHPEELSGPGKAHEQAGYDLLVSHGYSAEISRFARTHSTWNADGIVLEDVLVSAADAVWKGSRLIELEQLLLEMLTTATGEQRWQVFTVLDDVLERLSAGADERLAFQFLHPIHHGA